MPSLKRVRWADGTVFIVGGVLREGGKDANSGGYVRGPSRTALAQRNAAIARWHATYDVVLTDQPVKESAAQSTALSTLSREGHPMPLVTGVTRLS